MMNMSSALMSALDQVSASCHPSQISVSGFGSISVYPGERVYATDITDWDSLPYQEQSSVRVAGTVWEAPPEHCLPMSELRWRALHGMVGHGVNPMELPLMVRLHSWPELCELPEDFVPAVARICAALARKPKAVMLLPRIVSQPAEVVHPMLKVMMELGHVVAFEACPGATAHAAADEHEHEAGPPATTGVASIFSRLWHTLSTRK